MATDWIKMRTDLGGDQRVLRMARLLQIDEFSVCGRLLAVWSWADETAVSVRRSRSERDECHGESVTDVTEEADGVVVGVGAEYVDRVAHMPGFAAAMIKMGWLFEESDVEWGARLRFPRFDKHNGEGARERALAAKRKRRSREQRDKCHGESVTNVTPGVPEICDKSHAKRREEKSREDKTAQPASATGQSKSSAPLGGAGGDGEDTGHCVPRHPEPEMFRVVGSAGWLPGWLGGMSVEQALQRLDVRNPARRELCAATGIDIDAIEAEWYAIRAVALEQRIRNPPGLLIHRLAERFHVELTAAVKLSRSDELLKAQLDKVHADFQRIRANSIEMNGKGSVIRDQASGRGVAAC